MGKHIWGLARGSGAQRKFLLFKLNFKLRLFH